MGGAGYIMPSGPMTKVGIIGGGAVGGGGGAAAPGVNSVAPTVNLNSVAVAESVVVFFSSAGIVPSFVYVLNYASALLPPHALIPFEDLP